MNPYKILEVSRDATKEEIRKSYLRLVVRYHPDKCKDEDAEQKIKNIYTAYEILKDDNNKKKYNSLNAEEQHKYYDDYKNYFNNKYPKFTDHIKTIIDIFYTTEDEFKNDFNNFDFSAMYAKVVTKLPSLIEKIDTPFKIKDNNTTTPTLDINSQIDISFKDRYSNKYTKIKVDRYTNKYIEVFVPNRDNFIKFANCGETDGTKSGDINITVNIKDNNTCGYVQDGNDIYTEKEITLYEYMYGGILDVTLPDNNNIEVVYKSMIYTSGWIDIENKGMPYLDGDDLKRGIIYIKLKIKNVDDDNFKKYIKQMQ